MISHLLIHLNPSSSENLILEISYPTRLDMGLGQSIINYMSRVRRISQHMQGVTMDKIIPLFAIARLYHNHYPGVKSRYLAGNPALVNYNLLDLRSLLSSEETRQKSMGLPSSTLDIPARPQVGLPLLCGQATGYTFQGCRILHTHQSTHQGNKGGEVLELLEACLQVHPLLSPINLLQARLW